MHADPPLPTDPPIAYVTNHQLEARLMRQKNEFLELGERLGDRIDRRMDAIEANQSAHFRWLIGVVLAVGLALVATMTRL